MNDRNLIRGDGNAPYYRAGGEGVFRDENIGVTVDNNRAPNPGQELVGPAMFQFIERTNRAILVQEELIKAAIPYLHDQRITEGATGQTDGSGNLDLKLYVVPQGYKFTATRVNLEAVGFTPASPFSAATAWVALIRGTQFAAGSILDFGPSASGGIIFPSIFSTSDSHAPFLRGGEILSVHVVGSVTLANTDIYARVQGELKPI
jgi:hypothetical protein